MKKIIFTILIIQCSFLAANAQWVQQNSGTTADLRSVKFINRYTGWVCGVGTILKTTNSGLNWFSQNHPATNKRLESIHPVDSNVVYCVGWFETILKTTNGGLNWLAIRNGPSGTGTSYFTCYFINSNTGWVSGGTNKILRTINGFQSFDSIQVYSGYTNDIYFKNSLTGMMCGDGGMLLRTTNSGYNWYIPNIELHYVGYNFDKLSFVNNQYGWIIGRNTHSVYRTTDFGENWDSIACITQTSDIYCSYFSSMNTGWSGGQHIVKTTNNGYNWNLQQNVTITGYVNEIHFLNDSIGWAVGSKGIGSMGLIIHTTTSGSTYINKLSDNIPKSFQLFQNFPNPFNNSTIIKFEINKKDYYSFEIFDMLGRKVEEIFNEIKSPGFYELKYDASKLSSGVFYYKLSNSENQQVKKFLLVK